MNVPVLTIQDPLAAAGAVVLDCRPPLLPVSTLEVLTCRRVGFWRRRLAWMYFSTEVSRCPMGDLLGLICPKLGVAPLVDPGTDLEDERPTPVGSPSSAVDECMPLFPTSGVDLEVAHALLEVGVLPAMVTPIVDPVVEFPLSPAMYPMPPVPLMSFGDSIPLEVAPPAGLAVGSPARSETLLCQVSSLASVASSGLPPSSPVLRPAPNVSPPSGLAALDQEMPQSASLPLGVSADSPLYCFRLP